MGCREELASRYALLSSSSSCFLIIAILGGVQVSWTNRHASRHPSHGSGRAPCPAATQEHGDLFHLQSPDHAGFLIALSQIGIEIGPLLAGVGVAGFILGFALQETLSNFASGLMILFYQPFDVGDVVEAGGVSGKVYQMSLVSTTIMTFDNQKLIVPNNKIWGDVIRNKTAENTRRVDMVFGISYTDDIDRAGASSCRDYRGSRSDSRGS